MLRHTNRKYLVFKVDANWACLQVKVKDSDKEKTAFITKYGIFHFKRMRLVSERVTLEKGFGISG